MTPSTFGERFHFARIVQALKGVTESDGDFAEGIGVGSSSVTAYKTADEAPPAARALVIAKRCGVDPGWLSFGEDSAAPVPEGFENWLTRRRTKLADTSAEQGLPDTARFEAKLAQKAERPSKSKKRRSG